VSHFGCIVLLFQRKNELTPAMLHPSLGYSAY
jgi:hypothetical protein